jgi:hypothetical protein
MVTIYEPCAYKTAVTQKMSIPEIVYSECDKRSYTLSRSRRKKRNESTDILLCVTCNNYNQCKRGNEYEYK